MLKPFILVISALFLAIGTLGCQTNLGKSDSPNGNDIVFDNQSLLGPWVVIRYPAVIDPTEADAVDKHFDKGWFYQNYSRTQASDHAKQMCFGGQQPACYFKGQSARESLIRTQYYVLEFWKRLTKELPAGKAILWPQTVKADSARLTMEPLFDPPPAPILVDFFAARSVFDRPYWGGTAGNFFLPIFSIRTSAAVLPDTEGAMVAGGTFGWNKANHDARAYRSGTTIDPSRIESSTGVTFIDVIERSKVGDWDQNKANRLRSSSSAKMASGKVRELDFTPHVSGDSLKLKKYAAPSFSIDQSHVAGAMEKMVAATLDAVSSVNLREARTPALQAFLARNYSGLNPSPNLVDEILVAESMYLETRDAILFETLYHGEFGRAVRKITVDESEAYNSAAWGSFTAGLISMASIQSAGGLYSDPSVLINLMNNNRSAIESSNQARDDFTNRLSQELGNEVVELNSRVISINAETLEKLRELILNAASESRT